MGVRVPPFAPLLKERLLRLATLANAGTPDHGTARRCFYPTDSRTASIDAPTCRHLRWPTNRISLP
jgi:hypothetical protein